MTMTKTWTGKDVGVRKPRTGETPLSAAEVGVGLRYGAFEPKGRPTNYGQVTAALLAELEKAGADGVAQQALRNNADTANRQSVNCALQRMLKAGKAIRRGKGKTILWWAASVDLEFVDAKWAAVIRAVEQERKERYRRHGRAGCERTRRRRGQMTMAEFRESQRVKREARERNDKEARAAARKEQLEKRQLEAAMQAEAQREADNKAKAKAGKKITRATKAINRIADKYRGTAAPSAVPMPKARPKATLVEIPPHLITVCKPMTLPHERIQPTGEIAKEIGRYSAEPSAWVQAVAA